MQLWKGQYNIPRQCIYLFLLFFLIFLFYIGVQPISNMVIISDGQRRDTTTYIHVSIFPQIALPSKLPHNNAHLLNTTYFTNKK